jgi:hypothetical protein
MIFRYSRKLDWTEWALLTLVGGWCLLSLYIALLILKVVLAFYWR